MASGFSVVEKASRGGATLTGLVASLSGLESRGERAGPGAGVCTRPSGRKEAEATGTGLNGASQNCGFFDLSVFKMLRSQFAARRSLSLGDELDALVRREHAFTEGALTP